MYWKEKEAQSPFILCFTEDIQPWVEAHYPGHVQSDREGVIPHALAGKYRPYLWLEDWLVYDYFVFVPWCDRLWYRQEFVQDIYAFRSWDHIGLDVLDLKSDLDWALEKRARYRTSHFGHELSGFSFEHAIFIPRQDYSPKWFSYFVPGYSKGSLMGFTEEAYDLCQAQLKDINQAFESYNALQALTRRLPLQSTFFSENNNRAKWFKALKDRQDRFQNTFSVQDQALNLYESIELKEVDQYQRLILKIYDRYDEKEKLLMRKEPFLSEEDEQEHRNLVKALYQIVLKRDIHAYAGDPKPQLVAELSSFDEKLIHKWLDSALRGHAYDGQKDWEALCSRFKDL